MDTSRTCATAATPAIALIVRAASSAPDPSPGRAAIRTSGRTASRSSTGDTEAANAAIDRNALPTNTAITTPPMAPNAPRGSSASRRPASSGTGPRATRPSRRPTIAVIQGPAMAIDTMIAKKLPASSHSTLSLASPSAAVTRLRT